MRSVYLYYIYICICICIWICICICIHTPILKCHQPPTKKCDIRILWKTKRAFSDPKNVAMAPKWRRMPSANCTSLGSSPAFRAICLIGASHWLWLTVSKGRVIWKDENLVMWCSEKNCPLSPLYPGEPASCTYLNQIQSNHGKTVHSSKLCQVLHQFIVSGSCPRKVAHILRHFFLQAFLEAHHNTVGTRPKCDIAICHSHSPIPAQVLNLRGLAMCRSSCFFENNTTSMTWSDLKTNSAPFFSSSVRKSCRRIYWFATASSTHRSSINTPWHYRVGTFCASKNWNNGDRRSFPWNSHSFG